jgi:hypothetical protein
MKILRLLLLAATALGAQAATAALTASYQFNGNGNWSIDGAGNNSAAGYELRANVPSGSTVEAAFLYTAKYDFQDGGTAAPVVTFDGITLSGADWTDGGVNETANTNFSLNAFRAEVTQQVAAATSGGGIFTFSVTEDVENGNTDGSVLVVVYSNPSEAERTIALLDGFSDSQGDTSFINLASPLTAAQLADPNFEASLSLGINFSAQPGQDSQVDVNGTRMTSAAGGFDDGVGSNGGLITVGDTFGDDFSVNPAPLQFSTSDQGLDDEAYNLVPFLNAGDTTITLDTVNPSNDDNIFLAAINITAVAGVNRPPPPPQEPMSEPGTVALMLGLLGLVATRRRRR